MNKGDLRLLVKALQTRLDRIMVGLHRSVFEFRDFDPACTTLVVKKIIIKR